MHRPQPQDIEQTTFGQLKQRAAEEFGELREEHFETLRDLVATAMRKQLGVKRSRHFIFFGSPLWPCLVWGPHLVLWFLTLRLCLLVWGPPKNRGFLVASLQNGPKSGTNQFF